MSQEAAGVSFAAAALLVVTSLPAVVVDGATHGGDRAAGRRPEFIAAVREFLASIEPHPR